MTDSNSLLATGVSRRNVLRTTAGGIAAIGIFGTPVTASEHCISINDADKDDILTLRHVQGNEDRADEVIANRPYRNVNHLLQLSFWMDPRQPAEMVVGTATRPGVCEYDVAAVEKVDDERPPYPRIDGVQYTRGRVRARHIEGEGTEDFWDVGDTAVFAGFRNGGTIVADFTTLSTSELNRNAVWPTWRDEPTRVVMMPLR